MMLRLRLSALLLAIICLPLQSAEGLQRTLAHGQEAESAVVLRIGEREIRWAEYGAWLVRVSGSRYIDDVAREHMALVELKTKGLTATAEEARARVEQQVDRRVETAFGGDRTKWVAELERTGTDEDGFFAEHTAEALGALRVEKLVMSRRRTDEAGLKSAWEALYGPSGRQPELRGLYLEIEEVIFPDGTDEDGKEMLRRAKRKQVERRAAEFLRRARAGQDFGELIAENSMDPASVEIEGYLPEPYVITDWPDSLAAALRTATAESFLEPVNVETGYWVFQVTSIVETPFESVKERIKQHLETAAPTDAETRALFQDLAAGRVVRSLPELWAAPAVGLERMDRPVAVFGDEPITRRALATWLTARRGYAEASLFAQMQLVESRATELGIEVSDVTVQQRIEADLAARIDVEHDGNKSKWLASIAAGGRTEEEYRLRQAPRTRHGLLVEQMLLAERQVTDDDLRELWEERFGEGGESPSIRLILRQPAPLPRGVKPTAEQLQQYLTDQELEITTLLNELIGRIEAGEDFATLAKRYSQDPDTKDRGGLQSYRFRLDTWPNEVRQALADLEVGSVSSVVEIGQNYYIFENSGIAHVPFEEVAAALRTELTERRPSSIEVSRYIAALAREVAVRIDPALVAPYLNAANAQH